MKSQQLRPRVLVSYKREPYVYAAGNVRVTFDSNIRTTLFHRDFLENQVRNIETEEVPGDMILEVKFDEFLPEIIACLLQTEGIRQQAFFQVRSLSEIRMRMRCRREREVWGKKICSGF